MSCRRRRRRRRESPRSRRDSLPRRHRPHRRRRSCLRAAAGSRPRRSLESHPQGRPWHKLASARVIRRDGRRNITITHHQRWLYAERVLDLWLIQVDVSLCYNLKKWRTRKSKLIYCLYKTRVNWIADGRVL
ncbi:uncharacterized protein [Triticum aestivum]|uniref:uncharacterized protein isoform X3 n=1 Tax=Triticum aestivum TaxID=4565 RepID=UPI001D02671A|nr:uncharacterized protein LOC123166291 isoform X3 [Triticum aestivum]